MILIQILLIIALTLIGVSFIRSRRSNRTKAYKKILLLFFVPVAVVFVLFPDLSTSIANSVGVGRGADLLLYGVTVVLIFTLFNNYLKDREGSRQIVILARKIAILEATHQNLKK
jgi:hypothetical protein